jgi:hypothetical protein
MQANAKKPTQFGGKGIDELGDESSADDNSIGLADMGYETESASSSYEVSGDVYKTTDGECGIENGDVTGDLTVLCESADAIVEVTVSNLNSDGVEATRQEIKSSSSSS